VTKKEVSSKQEKVIAEYLGWKTVSASGARDFHKGDIVSEDWLGECKTHMKETMKLSFNQSVFQKISDEAMSKFKKPVLFVDDGTQTLKNTYALLLLKHISNIDFNLMIFGTKFSKININIHLDNLYDNIYQGYVFKDWGDIGDVMMLHISKFKDIIEGDY
jgi:hypothetical protein